VAADRDRVGSFANLVDINIAARFLVGFGVASLGVKTIITPTNGGTYA
jgi:hypothetical protein